jgi:hypothetical protein
VSCYNVKKKNGYNIRVPYIRSILQADFAGLRQKVVVWLSFAPGGVLLKSAGCLIIFPGQYQNPFICWLDFP